LIFNGKLIEVRFIENAATASSTEYKAGRIFRLRSEPVLPLSSTKEQCTVLAVLSTSENVVIDAVTAPFNISGLVGVASSVDILRPPSSRVNDGVQSSPSVGWSVQVKTQPCRTIATQMPLAETFHLPNDISISVPPASIQLFSFEHAIVVSIGQNSECVAN
jgi:hypothetical protein